MNTRTSIVGLLGEHIENSLSPFIHESFIRYYSLKYHYLAFQIEPKDLKSAIIGARALGIQGLNVTIPFKEEVIKYIDYIEPAAERIGAINTIIKKGEKLLGYNTDQIGFKLPLEKNMNLKLSNKKAVVLGAGGAARAVVFSLAEGGCSKISIFNRNKNRALNLKNCFQKYFPNCKIEIYYFQVNDLQKEINKANLLINTTPLGSWYFPGQNPISKEINLPLFLIVYDLIYYPEKTPLLKFAETNGNRILNGKEMLVYQAAESFYLWTGIYPEEKIIKNVLKQI